MKHERFLVFVVFIIGEAAANVVIRKEVCTCLFCVRVGKVVHRDVLTETPQVP